MAKPGPKPKPTRVHKLEGGRKKTHRPMPKNEPQPKKSEKLPLAPRYLNKVAQKEWRRMVKELHPIGLLTNIDLTALGGYCACYADWIEAMQKIQEKGSLVKAQSGFPMQSPYLNIANKAMIEMRKWLVEFGMTPSSRSRVDAAPKKEKSELEKWQEESRKLETVK